MEYKEIVSVTGESGLFQLLSSKSDGAIVRSLDGQATRFVPSRNHNFTPLESIEVFTTGENVPLSDVFKAMQTQEDTTPVIEGGKDGAAIKAYFQKVYPELDKERVYMSDMKKMLKWYPILKANDLLRFEEETEEEAPEAEAAPVEKDKAEVKSKDGEDKKETKTAKKTGGKSATKEKAEKKATHKKAAEKKAAPKTEKKPAAAQKKTTAKKSGGK